MKKTFVTFVAAATLVAATLPVAVLANNGTSNSSSSFDSSLLNGNGKADYQPDRTEAEKIAKELAKKYAKEEEEAKKKKEEEDKKKKEQEELDKENKKGEKGQFVADNLNGQGNSILLQGFGQRPGEQGGPVAPEAPKAPEAGKPEAKKVEATKTATGTKALPKTSAVK